MEENDRGMLQYNSGGGDGRATADKTGKRPFEEEANEEVERLLAKYGTITFKK